MCIFFILSIIIFPLSSIRVNASSSLLPRYNNVFSAQSYANISQTGKLTLTNTYEGKSNYVSKAIITSYIEKQTSNIWIRVNIGTGNNEWIDTIYSQNYTGNHSTKLSSKGSYRIIVKYVIYGKDQSIDTITDMLSIQY